MTFPAVAELVPHAAPMLLLDRVIAADEDSLCAEASVAGARLFHAIQATNATPAPDASHDAHAVHAAHDNAVVGVDAWVGIEYMAQAIAAHAGLAARQRGEAVKIGFLLGTRSFTAHRSFFPADRSILVHVRRILVADNGLGSFECEIRDKADSTCLAQASLTVFQPDDATFFLQESQA